MSPRERWVIFEVTGRKPRRSPRAPRRGPTRSRQYRTWVRTLACSGCGLEGCSEAAHTGSDGGMKQKPSDFSCVPLCPDCHQFAAGAYHRIGKAAFEETRGISFRSIVAELNQEWASKYPQKLL